MFQSVSAHTSSPNPANRSTGREPEPDALPPPAADATSYAVKLGTTNPPAQVATGLTTASFSPSLLASNTTYYWQIVELNGAGSTTGPILVRTTGAAPAPCCNRRLRRRPEAGFGDYPPPSGVWYIKQSSTGYTDVSRLPVGDRTDVPVPGDYDGAGKSDIAVYRPSTGNSGTLLKSSTNFTGYAAHQWGVSTDVPAPGDYDGDGKTDSLRRAASRTPHVVICPPS